MRQQTTNLPQTLTPLERLLHEKQRVTVECELRKIKLNADCAYIQAHAGSLLLSGLSSLLFLGGNKKQEAKATADRTATAAPVVRPAVPAPQVPAAAAAWQGRSAAPPASARRR